RSAHSMRRTPSAASAMSRMSYLFVAAISSLASRCSGGQQPLVLALFPFDPLGGCVASRRRFGTREPRVHRRPQLPFPTKAHRERELVEPHRKALSKRLEGPELVQLTQPVEPVATARARGDDETRALEIPEHAR